MLPLQKPFKVFSTCVSVVGQSAKWFRRMLPLPCFWYNPPVNLYYEICTRKHDHNSLSRFCWGAKGSRKGGVKAVLGYHNFEQHPHDKLFKLAGAEQTCLQRSEAWRIGQCGNSVGSKWIKAWSHIYIPCATMEYQKLYYSYLVVKHLARSNGA